MVRSSNITVIWSHRFEYYYSNLAVAINIIEPDYPDRHVSLCRENYPERFLVVRFIRKNRIQLALTGLFFIFILLAVGPKVLIPVPYGHAGVIWKRFAGGTDLDETLHEGTALVMPWNRIYIYSTKYQTITHEFEAVTKNGLATKVYVILRFRVIRKTLPYLHVNAGVHYIERMLLPEIGSWSRLVIARHSAEEVYSTNRLEVQKEIFSLLRGKWKRWKVMKDTAVN